jgi:uncharacterized protein YigE (DUF2233 family)
MSERIGVGVKANGQAHFGLAIGRIDFDNCSRAEKRHVRCGHIINASILRTNLSDDG